MKQNKTLLCWRDFNGLGDWLMALSAIKMLNNQYPDIDVYVRDRIKDEPMPMLLREVITMFDVNIKRLVSVDFPHTDNRFDLRSNHMIYPMGAKTLTEPLIEGMVKALNYETGLNIQYEPETYATFAHEAAPQFSTDYIIMVSRGKRGGDTGKEWGYDNFNNLCSLLRQSGHRIIQIGREDHEKLSHARQFHDDYNLPVLHSYLLNATLIISMTDGIMVYAGQHHFPQLSLYCGGYDYQAYERSKFPRQLQLVHKDVTPKEVFEVIKTLLLKAA